MDMQQLTPLRHRPARLLGVRCCCCCWFS